MEALRRIPLGRASDLSGRQLVFEAGEALEVDDYEGYAGQRRRLFYDEVMLVTSHRRGGGALLALLMGLGGILVLAAVLLALAEQASGALALALLAAVPLAAAVLRLVVKTEVITVYGKRSQARVQFWLQKRRARQAFERICTRAREAQERPARAG
jgi:hypothetical protein